MTSQGIFAVFGGMIGSPHLGNYVAGHGALPAGTKVPEIEFTPLNREQGTSAPRS
jgi:hypothetical protein